MDLNQFKLPSAPKTTPIPDRNKYGPPNAARLMHAFRQSRVQLARVIIQINGEHPQWSRSRFLVEDQAFHGITRGLCSMSDETITNAIEGTLHKLVKKDAAATAQLPSRHKVPVSGKHRDQLQPVLYTLIHCTSSGGTLTRAMLIKLLSALKQYIAKPAAGSSNWIAHDSDATEIDTFQTYVPEKNWGGRPSDIAAGLHCRRYCLNDTCRASIQEFIDVMTAMVMEIQDDDEEIPWSMVYTGWTEREGRRSDEYNTHQDGSCQLLYLVEAAAAWLFKQNKFWLISMSLVNITSPEDAFILEHAISILTGSYVEYGGMNVKVGGDLGMLGIARNATNETWHNGMRALYAQDVFPQQVKAMKEDLAHLELWDKYKNEGSELRELAAAQAELVKAEEEAGQIALATKDKAIALAKAVEEWADQHSKFIALMRQDAELLELAALTRGMDF